ncbi:MAG TPA: creatininase family protein [Verrucomicrobiae bacterium]|jgi:creatinine amidohydrolase/Fe(II)-dependent formamide hydrolase-like protein|nr:creatininase family protein [Verrucomicrobiae bacterium]
MKKTIFALAVAAGVAFGGARLFAGGPAFWAKTAHAAKPDAKLPSVFLEDLTWVEVQQALDRGMTTAILPTGGTEQNGPHMVLGKHNKIVRVTSEKIAQELGDALVAPVLGYVPEGKPGEGHMRFPGTISIPPEVFEQVLEHAARSLISKGFREIYFLGDSFDNQEPQERVAQKLRKEFAAQGTKIYNVSDYYGPGNGQIEWLKSQGETMESIGKHAGIRDTSELLAVDPSGVRRDLAKRDGGGLSFLTGVAGDPTRASEERGEKLLDLKIQAALKQIRDLRSRTPQTSASPS